MAQSNKKVIEGWRSVIDKKNDKITLCIEHIWNKMLYCEPLEESFENAVHLYDLNEEEEKYVKNYFGARAGYKPLFKYCSECSGYGLGVGALPCTECGGKGKIFNYE